MPLREDTQGRKSKGWRAEWSWKRLLLFAGVLSAGLNISFLILVLTSESYIAENWSASPAVFYKPPPYVHTFLRALSQEESVEEEQAKHLEAWAGTVSKFVAAHPIRGWGSRTGGVIVAAQPAEVCGVMFEANTLRSNQQFPDVFFQANARMVAGGTPTCKKELEAAVKAGWHQGQLFYYRIPVDTAGRYTVRMTIMFYHNDERRGDGITLGLDDLMSVHVQCVKSKGRFVIPPGGSGVDKQDAFGVVEFDTVVPVNGGEILLELEGIYTCVGLSLVEVFHHEMGTSLRVPNVNANGVPFSSKDDFPQDAEQMMPLQAAWRKAGPVCANRYTSNAKLRSSLQKKSVSMAVATEQSYFDEWARRERLEGSAGRYCRPHKKPRLGEPGWTWAGVSLRMIKEKKQAEERAKASKGLQSKAKFVFKAAVEAAVAEGVSRGTATALAAEAVERAIQKADGKPISREATKEAIASVKQIAKNIKARKSGKRDTDVSPDSRAVSRENQLLMTNRQMEVVSSELLGDSPEADDDTGRRRKNDGHRALQETVDAWTPMDETARAKSGSVEYTHRGVPKTDTVRRKRRLSRSDMDDDALQDSGDGVVVRRKRNSIGVSAAQTEDAIPGPGGSRRAKFQDGGGAVGKGAMAESAQGIKGFKQRNSDVARVHIEDGEMGSVEQQRVEPVSARGNIDEGQKREEKGSAGGGVAGAGAGDYGPRGKARDTPGVAFSRAGAPGKDGVDGPPEYSKDESTTEEKSKQEQVTRVMNPEDPIPPPMCPPRLVDLLEEALHVEARKLKRASPPVRPVATSSATATTTTGDLPRQTHAHGGDEGVQLSAQAESREGSDMGQQGDSHAYSRGKDDDPTDQRPGVPLSDVWALAVWQEDGAAAATARARSRVTGGSESGHRPPWRARGGLPAWLGRVGWGQDEDASDMAAAVEVAARAGALSFLANQALGSGFEAIAAYRAHGIDGNWGDLGSGGDGFPFRFTGFTWDGVTVVAKETTPGCARVAGPVFPTFRPDGSGTATAAGGGFVSEQVSTLHDHAHNNVGVKEDAARGRGRTKETPCLRVEAAVVPDAKTVVDIIVPVSSGLVPRLLTLLPQMERLAKGASCHPLPSSHPLCPTCMDPDNYAPAFWPAELTRRNQYPVGSGFDAASAPGGMNETRGLRGGGNDGGRGSVPEGTGSGGSFRVIVATEDAGVERMLEKYDVETVFVLIQAPFSKASAIQDASLVIPDDHILFVHDADLFPPCGLPDALRQAVVRGVQAVNFLLPYENQPSLGKCLYPLSTFGPIAMYASDFRAVGGMEDANSGRWGYEDTAFLHKCMLGPNSLGVLRVHLPGLVHRWHEITPWKCMVWVWGGAASGSGDIYRRWGSTDK